MGTHTRNTTRTRRHGTWKRATRAWLVAMLLAIFTIAMQVGTVSAAAPDPSGGGTTPTQGNGGVTVYRQDPRGTGPVVVPVGTGPVGTGPVVVGPVIGIGGGFLTPDPNLPCTGTNQCLKYLQYEAHGTYALFNFFTMQPAVATLQVSTAAPVKAADGTYSFSGLPVAAFAISSTQEQHAMELDNLDPGTNYSFLITGAKGPTGIDAQQVGTFTTLKRMVTVTINQITVTDDSDAVSAGDLAFNLKVNGSAPAMYPTEDMIAFNPANGSTVEWSSGQSKNVGMQVKIATTADQATVLVEGWDWDSNQPGWLSGQPIIIDQDTGSISGDRADVSQNFNVTDDEHGNLAPKAFTMQTTNNSLKYKATGTLTISYE